MGTKKREKANSRPTQHQENWRADSNNLDWPKKERVLTSLPRKSKKGRDGDWRRDQTFEATKTRHRCG